MVNAVVHTSVSCSDKSKCRLKIGAGDLDAPEITQDTRDTYLAFLIFLLGLNSVTEREGPLLKP